MRSPRLCALVFALALPFQQLAAHDSAVAHEMADAAQSFLKSLSAEQKGKVQMPAADPERKNWHFVPKDRKGLPIKEMTQAQRLLAHSLLVTGLSHAGYGKALGIMSLEEVLVAIEQGRGPVRDPELYYFTIFGEPGSNEGWGWRFEGHHLSLNFTAAGDQVLSMTPSFFGSNPGEVRSGSREGFRVLAQEEDLGRELVKALNEEQRKKAIIQEKAPRDVINVPGRNEFTKPEGLQQTEMTVEQKAALEKLIHTYLHRHRQELASGDWAKITKAGLDKIYFAWAGGLEPGQGHYYRVQGPTFVMEYDNTQNNANHVHSLWRDLTNDFGQDLLKQHYQESHQTKK